MKKDNLLMIFIKGFVIGLGIIFPVSASVLAISMGVYADILDIVNNFFKVFKKKWKVILMFGFGVVASCIVSCLLLDYTLNKYPIATLALFIGLVIGGIPELFNHTKKQFSITNILCFFIGVIVLTGISLLNAGKEVVVELSFIGLLKLLAVGVIGAGSMIVPGVSGSVMLIVLGYYNPLLAIVSETVKFQHLFTNVAFIGVFGIGMLIGVIITSRIMAFFLKKYEVKTYFAILGFLLTSVTHVIVKMFGYSTNIVELIVAVVLFIIGFCLSFKFLREE